MLPRLSLAGWLSSGILFTVCLAWSTVSLTSVAADDAATTPETKEADTPIEVPEGSDPETLQAFLKSLGRMRADSPTPAGFRAHFRKLLVALDEVIQRDIDEDTAQLAIRMMSQCYDIIEQFGDRSATEQKQAFVDGLKNSERPMLAQQGRLLDVETQISSVDPEDKAAVKAVMDQVINVMEERPLTNAHGSLAYGAMTIIEQTGDGELAESAAKIFGDALRTSDDPAFISLAATLEGSARRINLKGKPIEVAGTTVAGEPFNVEAWKGKVVLVDFWATWCGPCVAAMPELVELYEAHHEAGLEIVGISLDDSRAQLEEFLHQKQLPWPTLFHEGAGEGGQDHPLATYYGVSSIPTAFLVNREGKVVATDLYGEELSEAVTALVKAEPGSE
ncbi:MAG: TlpA family protein disulfide reductase [Planctomycetaceae bacterium]|nr:TlpA family protein disulfide reductase [Planctomycetaceae bacterium]